MSALDPSVGTRLKRDADGLVPAVVQQHDTREVLMVGWMDDEALHRTLTTGRATYWSRSRQEYWVKGETSGHRQWVREVRLDCDGDTLLVLVDQEGPACHTGARTCFEDDVLLAATVTTRAPMSAGRRRLFGPVLVLGAAASGLTAFAAGRAWAEGETRAGIAEAGTIIPGEVTGADVAPLAIPLGLVALAAWGAVLVLRRRGRRAIAVLGVLASAAAGVAVAVGLPAIPDVAGEHLGHLPADVATTPWPWLTLVAAVVSASAFAVTWWAAPDWPEMSAKYDAPAGSAVGGATTASRADGREPDSRELWKALDEGEDPTS